MSDDPDRTGETDPESPTGSTGEHGTGPADRKITTRTVVLVAVVAALVLAGAGTGIFLLTRGGDDQAAPGAAGPASTGAAPGAATGGPAATPSGGAQPGQNGGTPAEAGQANTVAEQAIKAFNAHDADAMKKISCDQAATDPIDNIPEGTNLELVSPPELEGDSATVELKLTIGETSTTIPLPLRKKDGNWCVD